MADSSPRVAIDAGDRPDLVAALRACATEADVVQVLFQGLRPRFDYDVISLQVLEREGWYHAVAVDEGLLQDIRRRQITDSIWRPYYEGREAAVYQVPEAPRELNPSRGLGAARSPKTVVFVPFEHGGQITGAVLYQTYARRDVSPAELDELREIHRHMGVVVANAYLNELTRNQAVSLTALNTIARALASTLDEQGVVRALHDSLSPLLPVDVATLSIQEEDRHHVRLLRHGGRRRGQVLRLPLGSPRVAAIRRVLESGEPELSVDSGGPYAASALVPVHEGGRVRAVLSIHSVAADVYEESTLTFLAQVADEAALALRNAESYAVLEAQRQRLEVVAAVGRRLASSLDRWSIMRTLREELARHLQFDGFALAAVNETDEGPVAEGYTYLSGEETDIYTVPLAAAGPSREAYETGLPVLVRRSRWARSVEAGHPSAETLVRGQGAIIYVGGEGGDSSRRASRSLVWVPVRHGDRITALLSLQSFRADAFNDWHVHLLQDVAAHVSLALANAEHFAAAQAERRRLEALHVIELGIAGAADERQIAESVFNAGATYIPDTNLVLAYLDAEGNLVGFGYNAQARAVEELAPRHPSATNHFRRAQETGQTVVASPGADESTRGGRWVSQVDQRLPYHVAWIPVSHEGRVVAAISAQRVENEPFAASDLNLLESAAPVIGIALRTVRLHRANELALAHSVRMQEVAALAGHDLASVVRSIAEQAQNMLAAAGTACWAIDADGRISAEGSSGSPAARRVLEWAGQPAGGRWADPPREPVSGEAGGSEWSLIPLWYAHVLVGALGSIQAGGAVDNLASGVLDFARHAAIAIENARLGAETRDRIRTLEAVAAFTELDVIQPARTRQEMSELIERALEPGGSLWLLDGDDLVRRPDGRRVPVGDAAGLVRDLRHDPLPLRARTLLHELAPAGGVTATPVLVDGRLGGLVVVEGRTGSHAETRRLMSVLAGQAGVVLGRLRLVDALERERRMMDAILRHSPVGVILEDEVGRVVYANPEAEQLYGVAADAMTGRELVEVFQEAGAEARPDPEGEAEPGAPLVLRMNEPERIIEVRRVPIPGGADEAASTLSMHEDVTEERQVAEAKDLMLRAIGHEVRSPAAAMRSTLAGILQWERLMEPAQRSTLLAEAYEMSDRLLSLVEGQLIIAKLETRRFEPNPSRVAVTQAVDHVMAVLRHRYGDRTARVSLKLARTLPDAFCEPTHLEQVLANLIGNALEYTTAPVQVTARTVAGGWLEVTVADEGQGLPAERVESLFRKTGPAGQNRARGGLGLGLYFCRLVVERSFGGRIWLASTGRSGTTFKFTVPAAAKVALPAASGS